LQGLEKLSKDIKERNQDLWFANLNSKIIKSVQKLGDLSNLNILKNESEVVATLHRKSKNIDAIITNLNTKCIHININVLKFVK
jgi:hypothetical protein